MQCKLQKKEKKLQIKNNYKLNMKLDINEVLADMSSVIKKTVADDWSEVKSVTNEFLQRKKERLEDWNANKALNLIKS